MHAHAHAHAHCCVYERQEAALVEPLEFVEGLVERGREKMFCIRMRSKYVDRGRMFKSTLHYNCILLASVRHLRPSEIGQAAAASPTDGRSFRQPRQGSGKPDRRAKS